MITASSCYTGTEVSSAVVRSKGRQSVNSVTFKQAWDLRLIMAAQPVSVMPDLKYPSDNERNRRTRGSLLNIHVRRRI